MYGFAVKIRSRLVTGIAKSTRKTQVHTIRKSVH